MYIIVRPLSTVEYTSVASLFHCRRGLTNLIHDRRGCTLFTLSSVGTIVRVYFTLGRSPVEANCVNKSGANGRLYSIEIGRKSRSWIKCRYRWKWIGNVRKLCRSRWHHVDIYSRHHLIATSGFRPPSWIYKCRKWQTRPALVRLKHLRTKIIGISSLG